VSAPRVLTHLPVGILGRVREAHPDVELVEIPERGPLPPDTQGDVLLTQAWGSPNLAEVVESGVRWVHAYGTGIERFPFEALGGRVLTCSRGASAIPISEWVLGAMLAFEKGFPERWVEAPPERWSMATLGGLHERTLGLVGLGSIGCAIAARALAFGMQVTALRRSAKPSPLEGVKIVRELGALLPESDHVVVAAPATKETRNLLDAAAFARIKQGAHLVNIARGDLIDQEALREALDAGRLARATLDVVTPEPLPEGHWLYTHPGVRVSPHISWSGPGALDRLAAPFVENLGRYRTGDALLHLVDLELGY